MPGAHVYYELLKRNDFSSKISLTKQRYELIGSTNYTSNLIMYTLNSFQVIQTNICIGFDDCMKNAKKGLRSYLTYLL